MVVFGHNKFGLRRGAKGFALTLVFGLFGRFFSGMPARLSSHCSNVFVLNISSKKWNCVNASVNFTTLSTNPYSSHFIWLMPQFSACGMDFRKFKWKKMQQHSLPRQFHLLGWFSLFFCMQSSLSCSFSRHIHTETHTQTLSHSCTLLQFYCAIAIKSNNFCGPQLKLISTSKVHRWPATN